MGLAPARTKAQQCGIIAPRAVPVQVVNDGHGQPPTLSVSTKLGWTCRCTLRGLVGIFAAALRLLCGTSASPSSWSLVVGLAPTGSGLLLLGVVVVGVVVVGKVPCGMVSWAPCGSFWGS